MASTLQSVDLAFQPMENREICEAVTELAVDRFLGDRSNAHRGPMMTNDWSFCFELRESADASSDGVYVKMPKDEIERTQVLPITPGAARLARDEYASLMLLREYWLSDDIAVSFVRPLALIEDYNAIITQRVQGAPFYTRYRRRDLLRRCGFRGDDRIHDAMRRLGQALARFHTNTGRTASWRGTDFTEKLGRIEAELTAMGLPESACRKLKSTLSAAERMQGEGLIAHTLKGLDVRNVLIDEDKIFLLDPGKIKPDFCEADVARFLMTCRILWWGHPLFGAGLTPSMSYERAFLAGYAEHRGPASSQTRLLSVLMLKELLKTWRMAYQALSGKPWPAAVKYMIRRFYIDPFFKRGLDAGVSSWR